MQRPNDIEDHLAVGHAVVMLPDPPREDNYRIRAHIRGWQRGKYLLLDTAITRDTRGIFRPGTACSLRFVSDGFACVCKSKVQDLGTGSHFSFVRVEWPTNLSTVPVRRYDRVRVHGPCTIAEGSNRATGELVDMSVGGCGILVDRKFQSDLDCTLDLTLPDGTHVENLTVAVCNVSRQGSQYLLGCTFSDRDQAAWHDIEFYVMTTLTRLRGELSPKPCILILDAQSSGVMPVRNMLEREGYEVAVAYSAVDAFFMLRMNSPTLLLMNHDIPDMDAGTFCTTLRASRRFTSLPILVYGDDPGIIQSALDAGASGECAGLIPTPEFSELIERFTGQADSQQAAAR